MTSRVRCRALAVAISSVALASAAAAQVKVELGATIGRYAPMGSFQPSPANSEDLPHSPGDLARTALGGQLRLWVAPRIGFELAATTSSGSVGGGIIPDGVSSNISARVSTGTAQLLFRVTHDQSRARIWIGAGGGAVQHGGDAYAAYGKPVNYGGVVGVGSAIRINGGLSIDLGVSAMIYDLDIRGFTLPDRPEVTERGRQVDMLLRTGLSYSWH